MLSSARIIACIVLVLVAYVGAYYALVTVTVTGPITKGDEPTRFYAVETRYRFGGSIAAKFFLPIKLIDHQRKYPAYRELPDGTVEMHLLFEP